MTNAPTGTSELVTIAIPTYNAERTLPSAIRSIFAQTYTNWELLILDDGSTDGSMELINGVTDRRVKVIRDGKNRGLPYRLNQATAESSGKILFRMDADDLMHPERVAKQVAYLKANPEIELVGTSIVTIDESNRITGVRGLGPLNCTPKEIFKGGLFVHPTVAGRRRWFKENPYNIDYRRGQDFELWCRTATHLRAALIPEPLLFYRDGFSSATAYAKNAANARRVIRRLGPKRIGIPLTIGLIAERWAKQIAHTLAARLNARHIIIQRRTRRVSEEELRTFESAISTILSTKVPGLESLDEVGG